MADVPELGTVQDSLIEKVLEGLKLKGSDRMLRYAADQFVARHREEAQSEDGGTVILQLSHPEVIKAVADYHRRKIELNAEARRLKLAEQRLEMARLAVFHAVDTHEDVDPEAEVRLDLHRLRVLEKDERAEREVYQYARLLVEQGSDSAVQAALEREFPEELKVHLAEEPGLEEFLVDLAEFVTDAGDKGKTMARAICHDRQIARRALGNEELPKPIRYLAQLAVKFGSSDS